MPTASATAQPAFLLFCFFALIGPLKKHGLARFGERVGRRFEAFVNDDVDQVRRESRGSRQKHINIVGRVRPYTIPQLVANGIRACPLLAALVHPSAMTQTRTAVSGTGGQVLQASTGLRTTGRSSGAGTKPHLMRGLSRAAAVACAAPTCRRLWRRESSPAGQSSLRSLSSFLSPNTSSRLFPLPPFHRPAHPPAPQVLHPSGWRRGVSSERLHSAVLRLRDSPGREARLPYQRLLPLPLQDEARQGPLLA